MATNKMKYRSITYPNSENSSSQRKPRGRLQRMSSFDDTSTPASESPTTSSKHTLAVPTASGRSSSSVRREVSAEGRVRTKHFQHTHSCSATLAPGQKLLRFSDECWYSCDREQHHSTSTSTSTSPHHTSATCLTSPKSRPGSAQRLGAEGSVERLVDWSRQSPEKYPLTHSTSQDLGQRHSRSKERRSDRDVTNERRSHYCASVSLPPPTKSAEQSPGSSTPTTTPAVTAPETRQRRSQFRRAWSLFSLACDKEVERERREKSPQQRILRPPTRHFYRRGLSGLPIECSTRYLGLAY